MPTLEGKNEKLLHCSFLALELGDRHRLEAEPLTPLNYLQGCKSHEVTGAPLVFSPDNPGIGLPVPRYLMKVYGHIPAPG
jgi:hypothetical protein